MDNHQQALSDWFAQLLRRPGQEPSPPPPRRLGLVLGGGGAKGAAHLGVLQVLEELELPIDVIVGTSAGGAVAVLHAAGVGREEICEIFRRTALRRIALPDPTRTGLIGQRRRHELLSEVLGDMCFEDLSIPCAVTATDLASGQAVLLSSGPLVPALLATTALPSIFPPVAIDGMLLADGGILNNVPVDAALELGATRTIAVEINDAAPGFTLLDAPADNPLARLTLAPQQFAVASRALSLLMARATELHLREFPPDLLLRPLCTDIPVLDMSNPEKGQQAGEEAAREAIAQLEELRSWRLGQPEPAPAPPAPAPWPGLPWLSLSLPWGGQSGQHQRQE